VDKSGEKLGDAQIIFVGCGRMGSALAEGMVSAGRVEGAQVICLDSDPEKADALALRIGAKSQLPPLAEEAGEAARIWVIAVKPNDVGGVLRAHADTLGSRDTVISVAAGLKLAKLRAWIGPQAALVRAMPNTPALVGRGVTGIMADLSADIGAARALFQSVGYVVELKHEAEFDALTGLSGSGPAYIFTAIEALADGGVLMGLSREVARELAVHTVAGAAAMVQSDPSVHSAELKDRVASPAGTTITALATLEAHGFRHALIAAVQSAALHSRKMSEDE